MEPELLDPKELEESVSEATGARPRGVVRVGRYEIAESIAAGGMATVHLGRLLGAAGFTRLVAIKRLHPQFAADPEFEAMFMDEARLAARIAHPNVVSVLDVVSGAGELLLVMDYVHGESLWRLMSEARKAGAKIPLPVAIAVAANALRGLHAAHQATDRHGKPLGIVHRDVSPHNIVVGKDGVPRVLDFGIAKAADSLCMTEAGTVRGKMAYMAPEQLIGKQLCRRTDIFAMGIVLWELFAGERLFKQGVRPELRNGFKGRIEGPSSRRPEVTAELDAVVLRALASEREERFADCQQMADALEAAHSGAPASEVARWVSGLAGEALARRAEVAARVESRGTSVRSPPQRNSPASGARQHRKVAPPPPPPSGTGTRGPPPPPPRTSTPGIEGRGSRLPATPLMALAPISSGTDPSAVSMLTGGPPVPGAPTGLSAVHPSSGVASASAAAPFTGTAPSAAAAPFTGTVPSAAAAPFTGTAPSLAGAAFVDQGATSGPARLLLSHLPLNKRIAVGAAVLCLFVAILWSAFGGEADGTPPVAQEPSVAPAPVAEEPAVKAEERTNKESTALAAVPKPQAPAAPSEQAEEPSAKPKAAKSSVKKAGRARSKVKSRAWRTKSRRRKSSKPNCSPPYTVDSNGRKRFKAACFK